MEEKKPKDQILKQKFTSHAQAQKRVDSIRCPEKSIHAQVVLVGGQPRVRVVGNYTERKLKSGNRWLTADIQLEKDSQDYYTASHKKQGFLYDWNYFESRKEARRAAVLELRNKKEFDL